MLGPKIDYPALDFPEQVENLHRDFLRAGLDVIAASPNCTQREKL